MAKVVSVNISEKKGEIKIPIHKGEFIKGFGLKEDSHAGIDKCHYLQKNP